MSQLIPSTATSPICRTCTTSTVRTTMEDTLCQSCGIRSRTRSSATSPLKSSECSTPSLTILSRRSTRTWISTLKICKSGFATTQDAYEKAVVPLFEALDKAEEHLATSEGPYYWGKSITEGDIRLYTTIVRFDPVYVQHFKTNIRDIRSGYPHLHKWMRHLYWTSAAFGPETTQFDHIKRHYTKSHKQINPFSITPVGPLPDILKEDEEVALSK